MFENVLAEVEQKVEAAVNERLNLIMARAFNLFNYELGECTYNIASADLTQSKMLGVIRSHVRLVTSISEQEAESGETHNKNINFYMELDDGFTLDQWGLDYLNLCLNNIITKLGYNL